MKQVQTKRDWKKLAYDVVEENDYERRCNSDIRS